MSVRIILECDGCDQAVTTTKPWRRSYGVGQRHLDHVGDVIPEGWKAWDPYTSCTYCPKCWDIIMAGED